ncbi:MAG: site-specific DNA-methyltransferase [Rhodobacteraceae bacterium]|nr:site-specific DNA-methyltransferase [Paracoccaceae bacterium]MYF46753.1 site-specific DNA-methyltransferase [Paracoccaceae bacterium]
MNKKQKLELTWIGKEKIPKLEPHLLLEDSKKSYLAENRVNEKDIFDNKLIFGDNLLALKSLEQQYAGKVKCVFIDPPYNTGSAFEHYDDSIEHSIWLGLMRDRIELLRKLLSEDGSLWITIDDNEAHYLKVLCDEVFGRRNFVSNAIWQKKYSPQNDAKWLSDNHDHILIYAKNKFIWRPNLLPRTEQMNKRYKNPDNDPRGDWKPGDLSVKTYNVSTDYPITTPSGRVVNPPKGYCWRVSKEKLESMIAENRIWFGPYGKSVPAIKRFLTDVKQGTTSMTIWLYQDVGHNQDAKKEVKPFNDSSVFDTPKPEKLMQRILYMASNEGDLVLDSFAGSGTTGAVAHKMRRKWIMVELGEHCDTHILPRMKKVIDGKDQGGISQSVNWKGGGGFRYYRLAPSLLEKDHRGRLVINDEFNAAMLAESMCKMMGFTYSPSEENYWMHGYSTENDFIYVTTQTLDQAQLEAISEEVGEKRTLLICCSAFSSKAEDYLNLTLKKIPHSVLQKCEWGKDDYSLNVQNLPAAMEEAKVTNLFGEEE